MPNRFLALRLFSITKIAQPLLQTLYRPVFPNHMVVLALPFSAPVYVFRVVGPGYPVFVVVLPVTYN